jgi:hypothetical protein
MSKARLKRYQSQGNVFPRLTLTGRVLLKYMDDGEEGSELRSPLEPGDVRFYLHDDLNGSGRLHGDYDGYGIAGYLKLEVYDGKDWRLVKMDDFYPDRAHHFSKKERPYDTYLMCRERMVEAKGQKLMRTYREHYALEEGE